MGRTAPPVTHSLRCEPRRIRGCKTEQCFLCSSWRLEKHKIRSRTGQVSTCVRSSFEALSSPSFPTSALFDHTSVGASQEAPFMTELEEPPFVNAPQHQRMLSLLGFLPRMVAFYAVILARNPQLDPSNDADFEQLFSLTALKAQQ